MDQYTDREALALRRKRRRRRILIRKLFIGGVTIIATLLVLTAGIWIFRFFEGEALDSGFVPSPFGKHTSEKVEKAEELVMPSWVEVNLIHFHTTSRTGFKLTEINNIVVHYVGNPNTTAKNNRDYFNKPDTTVSSHFVVGLEGEIIQCLPLYERSAATNNRNKDTISIEVCHPDATGKYNEATYASLIKLISFLCEEFSLDESDVIRHYDVTGKICPKYYVEHPEAWEQLKADIKESLNAAE